MKIFINHFNIEALPNVLTNLNDKLIKTETYVQIYSLDGIYQVNSSKIIKLNAVDSDISIFKDYYKNFTLIVDNSYFTEEFTNVIPPEHISTKTQKCIFELHKNSSIKLVIEASYIEDKNIFNKHNSFSIVPNNIYFEGGNNLDINDALVKEELIVFLSLLN
jgi:hypothetical protein